MHRVLTALPRALRRRFLLTIAVSGGGLLATGFLLPWFTQLFTDRYLIAGQRGWLGALLTGMALAALARAALTWAQRRLLLRAQQTASREVNTITARVLLTADQRALVQSGAAAPGYLLGRQHRAHALLYGEVAQGISDLPAAPLLLLVMAWFDPLLAGLACVLASVNALAYALVDRRRARLGDALAAASGQVASIVAQDLAVLPTIKASAAEALVLRRWLAAYDAQAAVAHRLALIGQALAVVPHALSGLGVAVLLAVGAWRVINGAISVGDLVACQTLLFSINDGLQRFIEASRLYPQAAAELRRQQILRALSQDDLAISFDGEDTASIPAELAGELRVKDLLLAGRPLRLTLPAGSQLAVAADEQGHTHVLCRALAGLEPVLTAAVALGGVALDGMVHRVRSALIALVGEGSLPLDDTLRENIRLWDKRIGDQEVKRALYLAGFEEALELPDGLDRPLGRHELSGGQLRRVALAQALIRRPRLIILDGTLEALDLALVRRILQRLEQAGLTVIVVSPRSDVLALCQYRLVAGEAGWLAQPQTLP